jgi:hypothetical protein
MKARRSTARLMLLAALATAGLAACRDSGLPDRNLPLEEARHREYGYVVYERTPDSRPVVAAGRHWLRSQQVETIPDHLLVPVAAYEGTQLYATRGARAPYSRLYARVGDGRWNPYLRLN